MLKSNVVQNRVGSNVGFAEKGCCQLTRTLRLLLFLVVAAEATEAGTTAEAFALMRCVA